MTKLQTPKAPKAPVAPPANSAAPGTPAPEKAKKAKVVKIDHPALWSVPKEGEDSVRVKIEVRPADYCPKTHKILKMKDFANESFYLEDQAKQLETKATGLRAKAEKLRTLGSTASSAKAKTLVKMQERMAELMASLKAEGVDIDALMGTKKE
jgi:hypothetical protein